MGVKAGLRPAGSAGPLAAALAAALALLAGRPLPAAAAEVGLFASPSGVRWAGVDSCFGGLAPAAPSAAADSAGAAADSLALWESRAADSSAGAWALLAAGRLCLARGAYERADSLLGAPRLAGSPWAWPALEARAVARRALGQASAAESLLSAADTRDWSDAERTARELARARSALGLAHEDRAAAIARIVIATYPAMPDAPAALAILDSLGARGVTTLTTADERAGADVEFFHGARAAAVVRLRRLRARLGETEGAQVQVRIAEALRASRRPLAARLAADTALALAREPELAARAGLELARALRDAGRTDSAFAVWRRVGSGAAGSSLRATAWWEYAREAQDRSRWPEALDGFRRLTRLGDRRVADAALQTGLVLFARGARDSALAAWADAPGEAGRFWTGIALRALQRPRADSILSELARRPGYSFYRTAARETLGVRGWTGNVAAAPAPAVAAACRRLLEWRCPEAIEAALARWAAGPDAIAETTRGAAALAYAGRRLYAATRYAERSISAAPGDSAAWAAVPWGYPPAYECAVVDAESLGIERALLWGLMRQESRFDPTLRSRSDALGLAQLKLATAADVARMLGEPAPTDSTLRAPGPSIRYGARYLAMLLRRFGNDVPVALAAYNAGPSAIRSDWRELVALGGDALYCEFASNSDTQDYVRRILGFRQAYRELRPTTRP